MFAVLVFALIHLDFSLCLFTKANKTKLFNYELTILEPYIVWCADTKIKGN